MLQKFKKLCVSSKPLSTTQKVLCVVGGISLSAIAYPTLGYSVCWAALKIEQNVCTSVESKEKLFEIVINNYVMLFFTSVCGVVLSVLLLRNYKAVTNAYKCGTNRCHIISETTQIAINTLSMCFFALLTTFIINEIREKRIKGTNKEQTC